MDTVNVYIFIVSQRVKSDKEKTIATIHVAPKKEEALQTQDVTRN